MIKMELVFTRKYSGQTMWFEKRYSVIVVKSLDDANKLFDLLVEQDDYWESYRDLIKVIDLDLIKSESDFSKYTEWCGKTDIYNIDSLRSKVDFLIYQEEDHET